MQLPREARSEIAERRGAASPGRGFPQRGGGAG